MAWGISVRAKMHSGAQRAQRDHIAALYIKRNLSRHGHITGPHG